MAGDVFPRHAPRSRESQAEVAVWEALRRRLPDGWRAWHSLRLRVGNRWEGEGDFVIANPRRGLLVLEVKGGAIELRGGHWYQNGYLLKKAPRQQAIGFVRRLADALRDRGAETPAYGVACAFPDVDFSDDRGPQAGDLAGLVIGSRQLEWLEHVLPGLLDRALPSFAPPASPRWLDVLHALWGETWVPSLNLADEARDSETRTVALVDTQLAILGSAAENPRAIVYGGAGTGKTLLARELCTRAAARGKRVLYLCFTDALGLAVDRGFAPARADGANVRAMPIRRLASELLATSGAAVRTDDPEFWATASLAAARDALPPEGERPDLTVVDEAQDFDGGDWDLVSELVGPRALWILGDERQAFWRRPELPAQLQQGASRLRLDAQLRNPAPIALLADRYHAPALARGSDPVLDASSSEVRLVEAEPGHELDQLAVEVGRLLRDGARPADIAILTLAGQSASRLLRESTLGGHRLVRADHAEAAIHVVADTFLRFKGLERPFVLLVELAAGHASQYERRMHIAITRATSRLIVIATPQELAADPRLATLRRTDPPVPG